MSGQPSLRDMEQLTEVFITELESPEKFFLLTKEDENKLECINKRVDELVSGTTMDNAYLSLRDVEPLRPCLACYQNHWYRASVLSTRESGDVYVLFVDYGTIDVVDISGVRPLPDEPLIRSANSLAKPCRLSGNLARMNIARFRSIVEMCNHRLLAFVDDRDKETGQYAITLYFRGEKGLRKVNVEICGSGRLELADCENGHNNATGVSTSNSASTSRFTSYRSNSSGGRLPNFSNSQRDTIYRAGYDTSSWNDGLPAGDFASLHTSNHPTSTSGLHRLAHQIDRLHVSINADRFVSTGDVGVAFARPIGFHRIEPLNKPYPVECAVKPKPPSTNSRFTCDLDALLEGEIDETEDTSEPETVVEQVSTVRQDNELVAQLRRLWAPLSVLRYPTDIAPPVTQSMLAIQQATVTRVNSPALIYLQTNHQLEKLMCLETALADGVSMEDNPIPECLVEPGICCAVLNDKEGWKRGRVVGILTDEVERMVDVELVDYGQERRYPINALRQLQSHYVNKYPPSFYHVCLAGHDQFCLYNNGWPAKLLDELRSQLDGKQIIVRFMTSDPIAEVELTDLNHRCGRCYANPKVQVCTVNEYFFRKAHKYQMSVFSTPNGLTKYD